MLKKLNNRGMTLVEVVVCFGLVTIVLISMYNTISVYKNKQNIESYKETVTTYKNLLTKEIQDDLIKKGLMSVNVSETFTTEHIGTKEEYKVDLNFKDGSTKNLKITVKKAENDSVGSYTNEFIYGGDFDHDGDIDLEDYTKLEVCINTPSNCTAEQLWISNIKDDDKYLNDDDRTAFNDYSGIGLMPPQKELYGNGWFFIGDVNMDGYLNDADKEKIDDCANNPSSCTDIEKAIADVDKNNTINNGDKTELDTVISNLFINKLLPDTIDVTAIDTAEESEVFSIEYGESTNIEKYPLPDLGSSRNNFGQKIYDLRINNVEISTENNILSIHIGFYHPELLSRYAIDIVCPINYS